MKDKAIYDLLKEYKVDFSEEVEEPINDLDKKKLKNKLKSKIKYDRKYKVKSFKQIVITALITLIIISSFSSMGKRVIADINEKFFFNPGLGIVNTEEKIYILENPLIVNEDFLIKAIVSEKKEVYIDVWFKGEGAKKLKEINENIALKIGDKIVKTDNYYSANGGEMDCAGFYFEVEETLKEVTFLIYGKEVSIELKSPEIVYGYDKVGEIDSDNEIFLIANKYLFNNKTYIALSSKNLYENNEIKALRVDKSNIRAIDLEGKEYEVLSSTISGNGREFYIDEIIEKPLKIIIDKVELDYKFDELEEIKLDIPKENESVDLNIEYKIEPINKSLLIESMKVINDENGKVIEFSINSKADIDSKDNIRIIYKSSLSSYCKSDNNKIIYGVDKENLSYKERLFNYINLKFTNINIEKYGEWEFILE